jgi:hypothetical protein
VYEKVKYPTSTGAKLHDIHSFTQPYHMILPAVLLSALLSGKS